MVDAAGTLHRLAFLFKIDGYYLNFLEPRFTPKSVEVLDERVRSRQKLILVTLLINVVPSMLQKSIEIKDFLSAEVARAGGQAIELGRIE